ncbi:MAG: hypothetical protein QM737_01370 [Ferruginibacter sp.]
MTVDEKRQAVIDFCKAFIKHNGYVRIGYAVKHVFPDDLPLQQDYAFNKSVSYTLINSGEYVTEAINNGKDYNIGVNPTFKRPSWKEKHWLLIAVFAFLMGFVADISKEAVKRRIWPEKQSSKDTVFIRDKGK